MTPDERKQALLQALTIHPVISTRQASLFFRDYAHPTKRASEALTALAKKKLVEGRRRAIGEDKVWRLTKQGRTLQNTARYPTPLNSRHIPHKLAVVDFWLWLLDKGNLTHFETEPRYPIGASRAYCPDAYFINQNKEYFLEVQRTPITSERWREKWKLANEYFRQNDLSIKVIVITNQTHKTVKTGCHIDIHIQRPMV